VNHAGAFRYDGSEWLPRPIVVRDLDANGLTDVLLLDTPSATFFKALTAYPNTFTYTSGQVR
jgi:hypothetical protein